MLVEDVGVYENERLFPIWCLTFTLGMIPLRAEGLKIVLQ